ncbi:MAG TPA: arginase [Acidobacteriota bacterium]|nr:arginase [Acidobacteriota bacterium]
MAKKVTIIGVPMDLGAGRRGVDMGPSVIRIAGLNQAVNRLGYEVKDIGNINVKPPESIARSNLRAQYLPEIAAVCETLAVSVEESLENEAIPVILGGDHSIAIGSAAGVAAYYKKRNERIGIIWLDAHTDINTPESTPSGNVHGMPLAALLGHGAPEFTGIGGFSPKVLPENTAIIGARSVDPGEVELIRNLGIRVFTMSEVDERGIGTVIEEAIEIATKNTRGFHATLDMDFLDPFYAPGVGTREMGGATYRETHLAMEKIADSRRMVSVEVTEVNPLYDTANQTAQYAVEFILSALGKKIM